MLTFLMLARLSSLCPSAVLQRLDRLVEPLRATCTTKVQKLHWFLDHITVQKKLNQIQLFLIRIPLWCSPPKKRLCFFTCSKSEWSLKHSPPSLQVKANSVKQEFEKQDELKRSAMRAVVALLTIPEAEKSPLMSEFQSQISSNQELAAIFDSIQRDSSSANMESMDTS